jgi:hypothetical protein
VRERVRRDEYVGAGSCTIRCDEYDVDEKGGVKAAGGEYDSEYDTMSMLASLVLLLA